MYLCSNFLFSKPQIYKENEKSKTHLIVLKYNSNVGLKYIVKEFSAKREFKNTAKFSRTFFGKVSRQTGY